MNIRAKAAAAMSLNMGMWLIMLLLFAGLVCCAAAIYLALAPVLSDAVAALLAGLALLGVCALLVIVAWAAVRSRPEPQPAPQESDEGDFVEDSVRAVIGDRATDWTRENAEMAVVGAVAAGIALGVSPKLRKTIMQLSGSVLERSLDGSAKDKSKD